MKNKEIVQQHIKDQKRFNEFLLENNQPIQDFKFIAIGYFEEVCLSNIADFLIKLKLERKKK